MSSDNAVTAAQLKYLVTSPMGATTAADIEKATQDFESHRTVLNQLMYDTLVSLPPDPQKVRLLGGEISRAAKLPNFVSLMCDMLETIPGKVPEDSLIDMFNRMNTLYKDQVAFAVSLTFSLSDESRATGYRLLQKKLETVQQSESLRTLLGDNDTLLQTVVTAAARDPKLAATFGDLSQYVPLNVGGGSRDINEVAQGLGSSTSLATLMEELGPPCCATPEDFRSTLQLVPDRDALLTAQQVARAIGMMSMTKTTDPSAVEQSVRLNALARSVFGAPESPSSSNQTTNSAWQTGVFVSVVKECNPALDWQKVMKCLDYPRFDVTQRGMAVLMGIYKKACGAIPPACFYGCWNNALAQARALKLFLSQHDDLLDNSTPQRRLPHAPRNNHQFWGSVDFVEALVDAAVVTTEAYALLKEEVARRPELLFAALVACTPQRSAVHYDLALHALQTHPMEKVLTHANLEYINKTNKTAMLVQLLADYAVDTTKVGAVVELGKNFNFLQQLVECRSNAKLIASAAMAGRQANILASTWFHDALSGSNGERQQSGLSTSVSRFNLAAAIVEVCDEISGLPTSPLAPLAHEALTAVISCLSATAMHAVVSHAKTLLQSVASVAEKAKGAAFAPDVEQETNEVFRRMYSGDLQPTVAVENCVRLNKSGIERDATLLNCIIHTLFEESRFFSQFPTKELSITAIFFGGLIDRDVLPTQRLQVALRYVLHALLKPINHNMVEFGVAALEAFKRRLPEWPQYGQQIKKCADIEMRIPGIMSIINTGTQQQQPPKPTSSPDPQGQNTSPPPSNTSGPGNSGLHQLDIGVLVNASSSVDAPSSIVQDKINFLVGNTDPSNLKSNAAELGQLLQPEHYMHFAQYLTVKRIALEPNFHKMYLQLVDSINQRDLHQCLLRACYTSVHALVHTESAKSNSSQRTLLKNLGSWLGQLTLARDRPVLMRDLDFREMIRTGLRTGTLIAVVPFVAKVLEAVTLSKVLRPPNPWIMSVLSSLIEMYQLPDLKLPLRFEVEVLCKTINISMNDIQEYRLRQPSRPNSLPSLLEIRQQLDTKSSADFRESQEKPQTPPPAKPTQFSPSAAPWQPKDPSQGVPKPQDQRPFNISNGQVSISPEVVRVPNDCVLVTSNPRLRLAAQGAIERTLKELMPLTIERSVLIAVTTTRETVVKDFVLERDENAMRVASSNMARCLAARLAAVTVKEPLRLTLKKNIAAAMQQQLPEQHGQLVADAAEAMTNENIDLAVSIVEHSTADQAAASIENQLAGVYEERRNQLRKGEFPVLPQDQIRMSSLLNALPEELRCRGGLLQQHRSVYNEFSVAPMAMGGVGGDQACVDQLGGLMQSIEEAARAHYRLCPPNQSPQAMLSLTHTSFTSTTQSVHHEQIKSLLVQVSNLVTTDTAIPLLTAVMPKVMVISERLDQSNMVPFLVATFLVEVCLFVLQASRDKGGPRAVLEATRLYLRHERRWVNKDAATNFIRLRIIDISEFDKELTQALLVDNGRGVLEFAGHVVQKCLIDEKLTTMKDLKNTLETLEKIAKQPKRQQPATPPREGGAMQRRSRTAGPARIPSATPSEHRDAVEGLFREWIGICQRKTQMQEPQAQASEQQQQSPQQQAMAYVAKLQQAGMLKADVMLDKFLSLLVELSVEDYTTVAYQLMAQTPPQVDPPTNPRHPMPPAPAFPHDPKLHVYVDAFSDLIVLLIKCCAWGAKPQAGEEDKKSLHAEVALVTKVLSVVTKVLSFNHDYFANGSSMPPGAIPDGSVLQEQFMQQPYFRFFSNLLVALHPQHVDDSPNAEEILLIFHNTFHLLNPSRMPGFAFAWLELVCHRIFVAKALRNKASWSLYARLLVDGLKFMDTTIRANDMTPGMHLFSKSFLKLMLVLLHDFPEFLLMHHHALCDVMPAQCAQLRNIVLSAFPRGLKLPDPMVQNLKIDMLPEIRQPPQIAESFRDVIPQQLRDDVDAFVRTRSPKSFPQQLPARLKVQSTGKLNVVLLNALVLHVGHEALECLRKDQGANLIESGAVDLYKEMLTAFDSEGRFYLVNAIANQLRFPNSHTHFFSCVVLHLFGHQWGPIQEMVQEHITRSLLERLVNARPHPWGLLITFIELVRNPQYDFWAKPFIHCTPDVERLFINVGQSLGTNPAPATTTPRP